LLIALSAGALVAGAAGPVGAKSPNDSGVALQSDNIATPLSTRQTALKTAAQQAVLTGQATAKGKNKVVKLAKGQYVELAFQGEDQILTVLGEFGNQIHPVTGGTPGPVHNQIPQPNRTTDNTTIWTSDFSQAYYHNLLFNRQQFPSMANFYLEQSSGQYTVDGYVSDWVTVPYNEARYGTNICGGIVCSTVWSFVNTSADEWWDQLVSQQGSVAAANAFLAKFDVWDRYDADGDGNFDEPDGYIDHFQSVHAGEGEETGGGAQGEDAIWSHRWYAYYPGSAPSADGTGPNGYQGVRIGGSNYWIGDYTIEPENGGVGVFSHEFAHDLGLPDEYDTSGNTGGAENSTAWWTIMSQGSYGTQTQDLGTAPTDFSVWDKYQLGFLSNYEVAEAGDRGTFNLGPAEYNTKKPQAMFVVLPDKQVGYDVGEPYAGEWQYFSGSGNAFTHTMTRSVTLPSGSPSFAAKVKYDAEEDYDYGFVTVNGTAIATNLSNGAANGITGSSGGNWVDLTADLSAYAGQTVTIGLKYVTDPAVAEAGFFFDDIAITGQPVDGAEADPGWTYAGFARVQSTVTRSFFNAYVLENRQYIGYDLSLKTGPYNFTTDKYVEHFPYQDGLLVWYWDSSYDDNNVGDHPGEGLILPVDSHPAIETWNDGTQMRPRLQSYDSTFTTTKTDRITVSGPGGAKSIGPNSAVSVFNDALRDGDGSSIYWAPGAPSDAAGTGRYQAEWNSVNVPNTGTMIRVKSISSTGMMVLDLNK
jgi:immune inhibitor A